MVDAPLGALPDGIYGEELERRISEAAEAIRARLAGAGGLGTPELAIVLGSGLGGMAELLEPDGRVSIPYREIPHVPGASVVGHAGRLVAGRAAGTTTLVLSGRAHPYEGYSQREVTILLRACLALGVRTVILTNASGGLNPAFEAGDVMLITDTINLSGDNPLTGPNLERIGPRFVPMADAFDLELRERARQSASRAGVTLCEGVYVMLAGPNYETRAEMRMLRTIGGDAVGMSTVPEVLVARHAGARVLAFSLVTNKATDDVDHEVTHEEVLEIGVIGAGRLLALLRELLPELAS
ncbi:MAG TPA: purine-nucleoside phosphorylase [Candidatus Limnocylindria bacterium]|nr:purine-nucleoside phosphorylase [Candidatus Limnocylindria bacterium]